MTSVLTPLNGQPNVTMSADGVTGAMAFAVNQTVLFANGSSVYTDSLQFDAAFGIDLWVAAGQQNGTNALYGKITELKVCTVFGLM